MKITRRYAYVKLKRFVFLRLMNLKESLCNDDISAVEVERAFQPRTTPPAHLTPIYGYPDAFFNKEGISSLKNRL
jgi:hypothetical protein